jgi:hypothetical protein
MAGLGPTTHDFFLPKHILDRPIAPVVQEHREVGLIKERSMDKSALEASLNSLDIWLIVFGILVAIGAVGGSVAGFLHWRRSGELQIIQTSENLALQRDIAY